MKLKNLQKAEQLKKQYEDATKFKNLKEKAKTSKDLFFTIHLCNSVNNSVNRWTYIPDSLKKEFMKLVDKITNTEFQKINEEMKSIGVEL